MQGVNKVILLGVIDREPGDRVGNQPVSFSVETESGYKDRSGEWRSRKSWHTVVALTEPFTSIAEEHLKKGVRVWVEGMLATRKWEDRSGQTRYATEVILRGFKCALKLMNGGDRPAGAGQYRQAQGAADYGYDEPGGREPDASGQYDMSQDEEEAAHTGRQGSRGSYQSPLGPPPGYDPNRRPRTTMDEPLADPRNAARGEVTNRFDERDGDEIPF